MNSTSTIKSRWAVATIFAINGFLYANWVARIPRLQELYELDHGTLGLVLLAGSIGALIAMPLTGKVIVRAGSDKITRFMLLFFCVITACIPLLPSIYGLGAVLFFMGASTGALDVAMNAQAVVIEQRLNKPIMSSFHAIFSAGMMLGAGSGALFNYLETQLQWHLLLVSILSILLALYVVRFLIKEVRNPESSAATASQNIFAHPTLLLLGLIAFCCMLGEGAMADWTTNYLEKVSNGGRYWSPFGLVAFSTSMMIGRFLGDAARQKMRDSRLLKISAVIATLGMVIAVVWPIITTGIIGFFLVGLGLAVIVPIAYSRAGSLPGLSPGVGISMVTTIGYAGFLVGPPVIGFVSDWQGLRVGMGFVLLLFVLMLLLNFAPIKSNNTLG
ncbi:MAG: MFS transporter [Bacteroidota bacterium]